MERPFPAPATLVAALRIIEELRIGLGTLGESTVVSVSIVVQLLATVSNVVQSLLPQQVAHEQRQQLPQHEQQLRRAASVAEEQCELLRAQLSAERAAREKEMETYEKQLEKQRLELIAMDSRLVLADGRGRLSPPKLRKSLFSCSSGSDGRGGAGGGSGRCSSGGGGGGRSHGPGQEPPTGFAETLRSSEEPRPPPKAAPRRASLAQHFKSSARVRAIDILRDVDTDGDGVISARELKAALKASGMSDEETAATFADVGTDGNGPIDLRELKRMLRRSRSQSPNLAQRGAAKSTGEGEVDVAVDVEAADALDASPSLVVGSWSTNTTAALRHSHDGAADATAAAAKGGR